MEVSYPVPQTPWFVFSFVIAERSGMQVTAVPPQQVPSERPPPSALPRMLRRIWDVELGDLILFPLPDGQPIVRRHGVVDQQFEARGVGWRLGTLQRQARHAMPRRVRVGLFLIVCISAVPHAAPAAAFPTRYGNARWSNPRVLC